MSTHNKAIVSCPACAQQMRIPTSRGAIKITCPGCGAQLDWRPEDHVAEAVPDAMTRQAPPEESASTQPESNATTPTSATRGRRVLVASVLLMLLLAELIPRTGMIPALDYVVIGISFLVTWMVYRGVRLVSEWGIFASVAGAWVLLSILGYLLMFFADNGGVLATTARLADVGTDGTFMNAGSGHFADVDARKTTPSELDALMEDW